MPLPLCLGSGEAVFSFKRHMMYCLPEQIISKVLKFYMREILDKLRQSTTGDVKTSERFP